MPEDRARQCWSRRGDAIWNRFRALGVPDPAGEAIAWLRQAAWIRPDGPLDRRRLLVETTRHAIRVGGGEPHPDAVPAFCCSTDQLRLVLQSSPGSRDVLIHAVLDGMEIDEVASLLDRPPTAVQMVMNASEEELLARAADLPEGMLEDGHLTTLQLHAYADEALDDLATKQLELHLGGCSWCMARFGAWGEARLAFADLPPPAPPPRRSLLVPLALGVGALAVLGGAAALAVLAREVRTERVEAVTWHGEPPTVELRANGSILAPGSAPPAGALLAVWVDPHHATWVGVARQQGDVVEVVSVSRVQHGDRLELAPVELLASGQAGEGVHVGVSDTPFDEAALERAIRDGGASIPVTTVAW